MLSAGGHMFISHPQTVHVVSQRAGSFTSPGVTWIQPGFPLTSDSDGFKGFVLSCYPMGEDAGEHMCTCIHTHS